MLSLAVRQSVRGARHLSTAVRTPASIKAVGVVGSGQMGTGIGLVAARVAKVPVFLYDKNPVQLKAAVKFMDTLIAKDIAKGKLTVAEGEQVKGRIATTDDLAALGHTNFVIEAATENTALKLDIFRQLGEATHSDTILATNTSSISVTKIAAATQKPDKVIGMHFMNPVPVMKLVEIIPGLATSDATLALTKQLAEAMGKTCTTSQDMPGFIANRLLMPYINEAVFCLGEGTATREDIDTTMKLGTNTPMGPLTLADFIGLDTCLAIMRVLYAELGDSKYRPAPLLVNYVAAGWLGKKSGRGFYEY
ncbi:hypothetical protein H4R34_004084 [Dimargaris verticillata]|uniref:3-hydroxybutyryl-CoA dehydrogenase n=1 Tax=Dimargaris verticillata TaxID=2761393 RepID=A0A9W8B5M6_9FUNG|nr:hypothetical protein H4R34_004084 [Dimargaris verticillata]